MNDRFKFRAKRLDNNKFVYGYLRLIYIDNKEHCRIFCPDDVMSYDCYTKTIGQCTGLKDKNGKLIYEGDICIPAKDMADKAGEVYRTESGAYFIKGKMKNGMEYDFGIYWHHFMYEVIGNIHENPELLEKSDD